MAIASNNSEQEVKAGGGVTLYVGIAPVQVVVVNPSQQELNDLGVPAKQEPQYIGVNIGGDEYNKLTFWVKNIQPEFLTRFDILVKPEAKVSKSGKTQWVNNFGQFAYAESKASEAYSWFKEDGERKAFDGEETLVEFIRAYANVSAGDNCYLETPKQIASGDVKELRELIKSLSDNRVRILLGVKETNGKNYQQVYTKHFGRLKPFRKDLFIKELNSEYGNFNAVVNSTLDLEVYSPALITPDASEPEEEGVDW